MFSPDLLVTPLGSDGVHFQLCSVHCGSLDVRCLPRYMCSKFELQGGITGRGCGPLGAGT
jgi:hypothetical protein